MGWNGMGWDIGTMDDSMVSVAPGSNRAHTPDREGCHDFGAIGGRVFTVCQCLPQC